MTGIFNMFWIKFYNLYTGKNITKDEILWLKWFYSVRTAG